MPPKRNVSEALSIIYQTILDAHDDESDRFWTRNNIFLLINSGLLVTATSAIETPQLKIIVSIFGIYFSLIWVQVNKKGAYYVHRWRPVIEEFENVLKKTGLVSSKPFANLVRPDDEKFQTTDSPISLIKLIFNKEIPSATTTELMRRVILGFLFIWISIAGINFYSSFFQKNPTQANEIVITAIIYQSTKSETVTSTDYHTATPTKSSFTVEATGTPTPGPTQTQVQNSNLTEPATP